MPRCYKCNIELVRKEDASPEIIKEKRYASKEHIIPNFCGGHLTSLELLCSKCNGELGTELEGALSEELLFHQLFPIKLDRGKQNDGYVLAYTQDTKKEILVNRLLKWKHFKPSFKANEDGEITELICQNMKQARQVLAGHKKKFPNLDIEENLKKVKMVEEFLLEKIDFNHRTIGSRNTHRAISKVALNYYLFQGGDKLIVSDIIKHICDSKVRNCFTTFHYSFRPFHELGPKELSHVIFLKGHRVKRLLYCYIELFNTANFIVMLSRDYKGENFVKQYCYDVLAGREIEDKEITLNLIQDPFDYLKYKIYAEQHMRETEEYIVDRVTRTLKLLESLQGEA